MVNFNDRFETKQNRYKIYTNLFEEDSSGLMVFDEDQLDTLIYKNFCNIINIDNFSNEFVNMGGIKPPGSIMRLIDNINKDAMTSGPSVPFSQYIYTHMRMFVNNRIGTYLLKKEIDNILYYKDKNFTKGEMVIFENNKNDDLVWVMFVKKQEEMDDRLGTINTAYILTKDPLMNKSEIIEKKVLLTQLLSYNKGEKIDQIMKPHEPKFSEEDLLETYTIN